MQCVEIIVSNASSASARITAPDPSRSTLKITIQVQGSSSEGAESHEKKSPSCPHAANARYHNPNHKRERERPSINIKNPYQCEVL